jgi:hypothetical protein
MYDLDILQTSRSFQDCRIQAEDFEFSHISHRHNTPSEEGGSYFGPLSQLLWSGCGTVHGFKSLSQFAA